MRISKKIPFGRVLYEKTEGERLVTKHATRGFRSNRKDQPTVNAATKLIDRFYGREEVK